MTPLVVDGGSGARSALRKQADGRMVSIQDQIADLAAENGLKVSETIASDYARLAKVKVLFDTPDTMPDAPNSGSNRKNGIAGLGNQAVSLVEESDSISEDSREYLLATPTTMDTLPPRYGEAYEKIRNAGGRKNRLSSGNLREQVVHLLPVPEDSLFRSPSAVEGQGGATSVEQKQESGSMLMLRDQAASLAIENGLKVPEALLPTPNTMDSLPARTPEQLEEAKKRTPAGYSNLRETVVNDLLPTPLVDDSKNTGHNTNRIPTLASVTYQTEKSNSWGKFAPAIERWEKVLGRPSPAPTKPDGKDGAHRLSSLFTEWLMGLPEGWVTGAGLKRNEELKACGNGVVPQQAALALRVIFAELEEIKENN
jgi:DNA (cytosine-5)-methyltransferase 1